MRQSFYCKRSRDRKRYFDRFAKNEECYVTRKCYTESVKSNCLSANVFNRIKYYRCDRLLDRKYKSDGSDTKYISLFCSGNIQENIKSNYLRQRRTNVIKVTGGIDLVWSEYIFKKKKTGQILGIVFAQVNTNDKNGS